MKLTVGAATSAGRMRPDNQDYLLYRITTIEPDAERDCSLFIAADGVGGAVGGAAASRLAAEVVADQFPRRGGTDPGKDLVTAIRAAGRAVAERQELEPSLRGMATTLVAAVVRGGRFWMANVGDSRGYVIRDGVARQLTQDHSYVADRVRTGELTPAAAAVHPYRHMITRSLGFDADDVEVDLFGPRPLLDGDRLLLCTDGLTEMLDDDQIGRIAAQPDTETAARLLVEAANQRGGPDNISVILVTAEG